LTFVANLFLETRIWVMKYTSSSVSLIFSTFPPNFLLWQYETAVLDVKLVGGNLSELLLRCSRLHVLYVGCKHSRVEMRSAEWGCGMGCSPCEGRGKRWERVEGLRSKVMPGLFEWSLISQRKSNYSVHLFSSAGTYHLSPLLPVTWRFSLLSK
jgi:hypothetical protein